MHNRRELKDDLRRRCRCKLDLEYWYIRNPNGPPVSEAFFDSFRSNLCKNQPHPSDSTYDDTTYPHPPSAATIRSTMSPLLGDYSVGFTARKSLTQYLLPSWSAAVKLDATEEFLEKAVLFWLLVFPEDILPEQEEEFYNTSRRLEVFQLPIYLPDFLNECYKRFTLKIVPDSRERCTTRDNIIRAAIASRKSLSALHEEQARSRFDPEINRTLFVDLLKEVSSLQEFCR